jgi:hypothetical protein
MRNLLLAVVLAQFPIEAFSQVPVNLFTLDYIVKPLCEIEDGAYLYSPNNETFLGYFNGEYRSQDILNTGSAYGSQNSSTSIRNPLSDFGKAINDENASYLSLPKLFGVLNPGQPVVHLAYISNKRTGRGFVALDDILSCYSSGPLAVTSLSAAQELNDIYLTWEASAGATSYDVFSAASATAAQSFLVNTTETNVVVEDVSAGSTIYYFIYPKNSTGTGDGVYINVYAGSPSALQALSASDGTYADEIVLTWEAAEGADIYKVLVADTLEGPRADLGFVEGTTVTLEGFVQETTYFFTVYPFNSICYSCDSGVGQLDTGFTSVSGLRNEAPVVAINGGDRIVDDSDGDIGEVVSVSATATDTDGELASTSWLVSGEVVASGTSANLTLGDGSTTVTFRATDDDGDSSSTSVTITVAAPVVANVAPEVSINLAQAQIIDTDGVAGEVVSVTATATDSDGELASTSWLIGDEVIASGTSARLALSDGSTMVTFRATDDDGDSKSTSVTITVEAPVETEEEFVTEYNGISAPSFLSEEINTVSVFDMSRLKLRSCIRLSLGGEPYSLNGYERYDMNFNLLSLDDLTFKLVDFRPFNLNGSRNQFGETPDCSGQFELSSNVYKDIIAVPGTTEAGNLRYDYYDLVLDLIDMDSLLFRLRDISIIAGAD